MPGNCVGRWLGRQARRSQKRRCCLLPVALGPPCLHNPNPLPNCHPHPSPSSCYESVPGGVEEVRQRVEEFMVRFNEDSHALKMELVLFKGAAWLRGGAASGWCLIAVGAAVWRWLWGPAGVTAASLPACLPACTHPYSSSPTCYRCAGACGAPVPPAVHGPRLRAAGGRGRLRCARLGGLLAAA